MKGSLKRLLPLGASLTSALFMSPATTFATPSTVARCIKADTHFKPADPEFWFEVVLSNSCARQLACTVDASVTDAKGAHKGSGSLSLARGSAAAPTNATYRLQVGAAGGTGDVTFDCR
jgi:hypothetical protein